MTDIDHITLPAGVAPEWHALAAGFGQISEDPAFLTALGYAYRAGVSADDMVGIQLSAPNGRDDGPLLFFGEKHGPYRIFAQDGERTAFEPAGRAWPDVTDDDLLTWEAECAALNEAAEAASRAAEIDGDGAAEPYYKRRDQLERQILAAPCNSRTAALVKARSCLDAIEPSSTDWEDLILIQLAEFLASDH